jgi:hypothetical protein
MPSCPRSGMLSREGWVVAPPARAERSRPIVCRLISETSCSDEPSNPCTFIASAWANESSCGACQLERGASGVPGVRAEGRASLS